ncbi:microtubule-associated protein futsch-like isoform X1 [Plodia interpunctella]|uniref:microtubule-associated protein futsch-like isoform X1 n=1 Tax=Plodia interpunctella TaxID=58824 RepID=UPI002368DC10|nr:microtubule-associated protein futsch-like isoform X1 [Plodia interpunctella]XP_053608169.1 microtubule-associated protein futsch-like isoform X1 [Plodia interpunctella]
MGKPPEELFSPHQSATTLLVSVEDLINMAMGPEDRNTVNYKLVQTVLHILARQMRLLEQRVEIKVTEYITQREKDEKEAKKLERSRAKERSKTREAEKIMRTAEKERKNIEKLLQKEKYKAQSGPKERQEKVASKDRGKAAALDKEKAEIAASKEREKAEKAAAKAERAVSKEREKEAKGAAKEKERADRAISKERERAEKAAAKEKEREERGASKERERAERAAAKEKEREERGVSKEKAKAERAAAKEKEREERASSKEREKAEKAAAKEREREERKADKTSAKEREREEKAASKADRKAEKEREREEKAAAKADKDASKERKDKATSKADSDTPKERKKKERAEKKDRDESKEKETGERAASTVDMESADESEKEEDTVSKADRKVTKEREKEEKAASKAEREAAKEREREEKAALKADKAELKEKEREERAAAKEERALAKDKEREERAQSKEREKAEKEAAKAERHDLKDKAKADKEQEKAERAEEKAKAKAEKELAKEEKAKRKKEKEGEGIEVTEEERDKEKILVVEKGPTTRSSAGPRSRPNIEVVTRSQFDLLMEIVNELKAKAGPTPMPSMPQNKELLKQLSKGTASLTEMMDALQVSARVVAAEQAIGRMGGILTQLVSAGALPEDIAGQIGEVTTVLEAELHGDSKGGVSSSEVPGGKSSKSGTMSRKSLVSTKSGVNSVGRPSTVDSTVSEKPYIESKVTHPELDDAIHQLKEDLAKNMGHLTAKSSATVENIMTMVKTVTEKLDTALKINNRISTLHSMVTDYAEQLSGFDAGLTTQLKSFAEQMTQIRGDLGAGLKLLETVNNNAETAAVMELTERYEALVSELDHTLHAHSEMSVTQDRLGEDMRNLIDAVEMLREQKADRDEVQDGLRDKADMSRLTGLLRDEEFNESRTELENRLTLCHEKFHRQDGVWMKALKELKDAVDLKADLVHVLGTREDVQRALGMLHDMCQNLALVLGEPKAAILTRKLTRGGACGACAVPALMELENARPRPAGAPAAADHCEVEFQLPAPPDSRKHICNRWVGGSHTRITGAVSRLQAEPFAYTTIPTSKYTGYGGDGRLYMMEEELQPCLECNKLDESFDD